MSEQHVPEFPPSDLICTPAEWNAAYEAGRRAWHAGQSILACPRGKTADPWRAGFERARGW